ALAQHNTAECFWLRGLIPQQQWLAVPPPTDDLPLEFTGANGLEQGMFGAGTASRPVEMFGNASGGEDSAVPSLRKAGVAIVCFNQILPEIEIRGSSLAHWGARVSDTR
ncbi:unnamed protein product, partial [Prorocentrum cordatum]